MDYQKIFKSQEFDSVLNAIYTPSFRTPDFNVAPRNMSNWDSKGLFISKRRTQTEGRKINFIEFIWINTIKALRNLGYPIPKISIAKEYLVRDLTFEELRHISQLETESLQALNITKTPFTVLTLAILQFIHLREEIKFIFFEDGSVLLWNINKQVQFEQEKFNLHLQKPFVSISLSSLMKDYIVLEESFENPTNLDILSNEERTVVKLIRSKSIDSITVKLLNQEKINLIETKTIQQEINLESRFLDHLLFNGYEEIRVVTEKGNAVVFEKVGKYKFK